MGCGDRHLGQNALHHEFGHVEYDEFAQCPVFDRFLLRIMGGNANLLRFLQKFAGYCLTGNTGEQVMVSEHWVPLFKVSKEVKALVNENLQKGSA